MKAFMPSLLAAALALGATAASAHTVTYVGTLSNLGEPTEAAGSLGTGAVSLSLDDHDFTMSLNVAFSNLTGTVTAAHIHCCTVTPFEGTAGVASPVPSFPAFPTGVTSGSYSMTFDLTQASSWNPAYIAANGGTVSGAFAAFSTGLSSGGAYLNLHSTLSPGGEVRAFFTASPVPEPEAYALMAAGLGMLVFVARRRNGRA